MIALVWLVAAILSAPVWAGSVLLQHYAPVMRTTPQVVASSVGNRDGGGGAFVTNESLPTGLLDGELHGNGNVSGRDQQMQQQYLMNLCYSISLILFGFVWPLAALCWLYLRMYEAALKNSARTRRQSLCSNTNNNANAAEGIVGVAAAAAASTVAATASSNAEPSVGSYGATGAATTHPPTLADAITSVTTTASAFASENQASPRLLATATAAASASTPQRLRSNRCVPKSIRRSFFFFFPQQLTVYTHTHTHTHPLSVSICGFQLPLGDALYILCVRLHHAFKCVCVYQLRVSVSVTVGAGTSTSFLDYRLLPGNGGNRSQRNILIDLIDA